MVLGRRAALVAFVRPGFIGNLQLLTGSFVVSVVIIPSELRLCMAVIDVFFPAKSAVKVFWFSCVSCPLMTPPAGNPGVLLATEYSGNFLSDFLCFLNSRDR